MRRSEVLVGTFLGLLLAGVVGYVLWIWFSPAPDPASQRRALVAGPPAAPIWVGQTAREGYDMAAAEALTWATDASLVTAMATWPTGTSFLEGKAPWNFTFFAPSKGQAALITVNDQAASLVSVQDHEPVPALRADISDWRIDSTEVIDQLLTLDDSTLTAAEAATLVLTLTNGEPMRWEAILLPADPTAAVSVQMNAETGQLLAGSP